MLMKSFLVVTKYYLPKIAPFDLCWGDVCLNFEENSFAEEKKRYDTRAKDKNMKKEKKKGKQRLDKIESKSNKWMNTINLKKKTQSLTSHIHTANKKDCSFFSKKFKSETAQIISSTSHRYITLIDGRKHKYWHNRLTIDI